MLFWESSSGCTSKNKTKMETTGAEQSWRSVLSFEDIEYGINLSNKKEIWILSNRESDTKIYKNIQWKFGNMASISSRSMRWKFGTFNWRNLISRLLFQFQLKELKQLKVVYYSNKGIPHPHNIPTPTPAPAPLLGEHEWSCTMRKIPSTDQI